MTTSVNRLILLLILLAATACKSQAKPIDFLVPQNADHAQLEGIGKLLAVYQPIYDFKPNEKIASIGAGHGVREIVFSLMADSLTIYLQDINPYWIEPEKLATMVRYVYKQAGRTNHQFTFIPVRGKQKETGLPKQFFDKIIVENSLHEFSCQPDMLQCIRENLKPNGQLFIWEALAKKPGKKHADCRKPMFTADSLIQLLTNNGFQFVDQTAIGPLRWNNAVFRFQVAEGVTQGVKRK